MVSHGYATREPHEGPQRSSQNPDWRALLVWRRSPLLVGWSPSFKTNGSGRSPTWMTPHCVHPPQCRDGGDVPVCLAAGRAHSACTHSGPSPPIRGQAAQARPTKRRCSTWRNPATTRPGGATKTPVTHVGNEGRERESCSAALVPYLPEVLLRARAGSREACPVFPTHVTRPRNSTCTGSSATSGLPSNANLDGIPPLFRPDSGPRSLSIGTGCNKSPQCHLSITTSPLSTATTNNGANHPTLL
jgi:hypothetical protein